MRKLADVFQATSMRKDNGTQDGMPIFGRFAAIVETQWLSIDQGEDGSWYALLPHGCSVCGDFTEAEAEAMAWGWCEIHGWSKDRESQVVIATKMAAERHNKHVAKSGSYAKKFGGAVAV